MYAVTLLGSGSSGNCALIETQSTKLLVDAGLSARQIQLRLQACGVNPLEIDGIVLTHEHIDHCGAVGVWCKQFATPVYSNRLTAEYLQRSLPERNRNWRIFSTGTDFSIGDLTIQPFAVPHDAVEPVGLVIHHHGDAIGFLTDLGFATKLVYERLRSVRTLVIETNHDEKLLQSDLHRPWSVKQRIMSRHGHLSNAAAAEVVAQLLGLNLRRAVLGHLSRDCNSPELAVGAVRQKAVESGAAADFEIVCASQREPTPRLRIDL